MQGKGDRASFDSFLRFYKLFITKYECKNKCLNYYVETIPRTMKREIKKMSLKQSKIETSHHDLYTRTCIQKKLHTEVKKLFRFQNSPEHKHFLLLITDTNIKCSFYIWVLTIPNKCVIKPCWFKTDSETTKNK